VTGISIHVFDVARGLPATGMDVLLRRLDPGGPVLIASGRLSEKGTLDEPALGRRMVPGLYEAEFRIGDFFRAKGDRLPDPAFLEIVPFRFGLADPDQHYHLPLKMTPWGFSLFRGGA
jgi:5-hydroxyisourate hydrolase